MPLAKVTGLKHHSNMRSLHQAQFSLQIQAPFGWVGIGQIMTKNSNTAQTLIELSTKPFVLQNTATPQAEQLAQQIKSYLQQASPIALQVLPLGTAYQQAVWQAIANIPFGQTRTYAQLANQIGSGARAVANACGANSLPIIVPCHRVVAKNGLGGFMQGDPSGLVIKQWLLQHEGAHWQ